MLFCTRVEDNCSTFLLKFDNRSLLESGFHFNVVCMIHQLDHCVDFVQHKISRRCHVLNYCSPEKWEKPPHIGSINLLVAGVVFVILFIYWSVWILFLRPFLETHTIQQFSTQLIMLFIHVSNTRNNSQYRVS